MIKLVMKKPRNIRNGKRLKLNNKKLNNLFFVNIYYNMFDPSFVTYIVGKRNSGKSYLLIQMLLSKDIFKGKFDEVIIINPTIHYDDKYKVVKFTKIYDEFSVELLEELIEYFEKEKEQNKDKRTLLILDDCISQEGFKNNMAKHPLNTMAVNGRHWGLSMVILSQKWSAISSYVRAQLDYVILFEFKNQYEIEALYREYGAGSKDQFLELFHGAFKEPHDTLLVNNINNKFYRNFNEILEIKSE